MSYETLRTPESRFTGLAGYPFGANYADISGLRLHYVDEGTGRVVVLFHGEPTWSYLYRKIIPVIAGAGYRVIAPDYPGFGKSDKPTDPGFYTYDTHVAIMAELLGSLDISSATAVVQDWGGPIGLRLAVEHSEWFDRLVVMNTALFTGGGVSEGFLAWRNFVAKNPDLPVRFVMQRSAVTDWPDQVLDAYKAPFPDAAHKVGAYRFPLIVPIAPGEVGAAEMRDVAARLAGWDHPVLVLFSTEDPVFSVRDGERWAKRLIGAGPLELVENAGHFLQEDQGEVTAERIVAFLRRTD